MKHRSWKLAIQNFRGHDRLAKEARDALFNNQISLAADRIESGQAKFPHSDTFKILQARHLLLTANALAARKAIEGVDCATASPLDCFELSNCYRELGCHAECADASESVLRSGSLEQQPQAAASLAVCYLKMEQHDRALDASVECVRLGGWQQLPFIKQLGDVCAPRALERAIDHLQRMTSSDSQHENHRHFIVATFARSISRWPLACASLRNATKAAVAASRPDINWDDSQPAMRPSVLVIGAMKAGSSTLFNCLTEHPKFITPQSKELQFFGDSSLPDEFYFEQFARVAPEQREGLITGEGSPGYYAMPIISRVAAMLPEVKCIFIKRDPVDRVISHFFHNRHVRFEESSLSTLTHGREQILELARLSAIDFNKAFQQIHSGEMPVNHFLLYGCYELFLRSWRASFEDRLLELELEAFSQNPQSEMDKVFEFVGLENHRVTLPGDLYAGSYDAQSDMLTHLRHQLTEFYQAVDAELKSCEPKLNPS